MQDESSSFFDAPGVLQFNLPEDWESFRTRYQRYAHILDPSDDANDLIQRYSLEIGDDNRDVALRKIFEFIQKEASHVVVEESYFDSDHQDEYAKHYAHTFQPEPGVCERLHVFRSDRSIAREADEDHEGWVVTLEHGISRYRTTGELDALLQAVDRYADSQSKNAVSASLGEYLGFVVLRPSLSHPVARTVLRPPPDLVDKVSCLVEYRARPAGFTHTVTGFPFISQDGQLASCAHAAIWMIAYYHHEKNGMRRVYLSDIATAAGLRPEETPGEVERGMTFDQIARVLRQIGLPAFYKGTAVRQALPKDLPTIIKRYLNSQLPVLVASRNHAIVLTGYGIDRDGDYFICHDDLRGPYQRVWPKRLKVKNWQIDGDEDSLHGDVDHEEWGDTELGPWAAVFVPRPSHTLYMAGEEAENLGERFLERAAFAALAVDNIDEFSEHKDTQLRTYTIQANDYKARLRARLPREVSLLHLAQPMPKWIWVVELQDAHLATFSADCVIGEVVLDATAHWQTACALCGNLPGLWFKQESILTPAMDATKLKNYPHYATGVPLLRKN